MSVMTEKWVNLPSRPGVYLMRDKGGKVIYVGKAKDLRSRVRAYFNSADERSQIQFLVRRVEDIETLVTAQRQGSADPRKQSDQAVQAALQHSPQRRQELSQHQSDHGESLAAHFRDPQDRQRRQPLLRSLFVGGRGARNHRHHRKAFFAAQLHRSQFSQSQPALPAVSNQTLHGPLRAAGGPRNSTASRSARRCCSSRASSQELSSELKQRMREKSDALEFEAAARIRDQIQAVEKTLEKQRMVSHWGADQDIFGLYREGGFIEVQVLLVRQGKLTDNHSYSWRILNFPTRKSSLPSLPSFIRDTALFPTRFCCRSSSKIAPHAKSI